MLGSSFKLRMTHETRVACLLRDSRIPSSRPSCLRLSICVFHCHHYTAIPILFFRKKTIDDSRTRLAAPTVEVLECMKSWMKGGYHAETPEIQGVAELFVRTQ